MKLKYIAIIIILMLSVNIVNASFFGEFIDRFMPKQQGSQPISHPDEQFKAFYDEMLVYNTTGNINLISAYMQSMGVGVISVHVPEYYRNFYVVRGTGLQMYGDRADMLIKLTVPQIRRIEGFMADGQLSRFEKLQMWGMVRT